MIKCEGFCATEPFVVYATVATYVHTLIINLLVTEI